MTAECVFMTGESVNDDRRHVRESVIAYERATQLDPNFKEAWANMAQVLSLSLSPSLFLFFSLFLSHSLTHSHTLSLSRLVPLEFKGLGTCRFRLSFRRIRISGVYGQCLLGISPPRCTEIRGGMAIAERCFAQSTTPVTHSQILRRWSFKWRSLHG